jgi:D-alanyl-D-alanine dipeptidase
MPIKFTGAVGTCLILTTIAAAGGGLPPGFVYLADVAPTIRQDIRYSGSHNFIGRPVDGYQANECVLIERAASALAQVQAELARRNLSLIVWDCYRPARAVKDFAAWSAVPEDARMKAEFFPNTDKAHFFALGYLASRSAHSRGSTVDLGIMPSNGDRPPGYDPAAPLKPCTAPKGVRFEDGTIDLGTGYDCLDPQASTASPNIPRPAAANRAMLQDLMKRAGFRPYWREWWHFEFADEPVPFRTFDFPVVARGSPEAVRSSNEAVRVPNEAVVKAPNEAVKLPKPSPLRLQWASFRDAVLKRDAANVASMTQFPLTRATKQWDEVAFVADFENIFSGEITACIALETPEQSPKSAANDGYALTCRHGKKDRILMFQTIDGRLHLTAISPDGE